MTNRKEITIKIGTKNYSLRTIIDRYGIALYCVLRGYFAEDEELGSKIFAALVRTIGADSVFYHYKHFEVVLTDVVSKTIESNETVFAECVRLTILFEVIDRYPYLEILFKGGAVAKLPLLKKRIGYFLTNHWNYEAEVFVMQMIAKVEAMTGVKKARILAKIYVETKGKLKQWLGSENI